MPSNHRWFIVSLLVFLLSVSFNAYADSLSQNLLEIGSVTKRDGRSLGISEAFARITGTAVSPALDRLARWVGPFSRGGTLVCSPICMCHCSFWCSWVD